MPQSTKHFAEKLNTCLDDSGAPANTRERSAILSKMLNIAKQQAWSLLEGQQAPSQELLQKIATEFEVDLKWLTGDK